MHLFSLVHPRVNNKHIVVYLDKLNIRRNIVPSFIVCSNFKSSESNFSQNDNKLYRLYKFVANVEMSPWIQQTTIICVSKYNWLAGSWTQIAKLNHTFNILCYSIGEPQFGISHRSTFLNFIFTQFTDCPFVSVLTKKWINIWICMVRNTMFTLYVYRVFI